MQTTNPGWHDHALLVESIAVGKLGLAVAGRMMRGKYVKV